jgi:uncharacterized OB-fold protein
MAADRLPRPAVSPSPDAAPFWEATRRRELQLPYCAACERFFFYPRTLCPTCGTRDPDWRRVSGRGRLHSFCIHHHSALPGFRDAVPFVTALVELEEGPRIMSFLTGVETDPSAIRCEMPLKVAFVDLDDGEVLPVFRPAGEEA